MHYQNSGPRPRRGVPDTGEEGVLQVNPPFLRSLNSHPLLWPSYRVGWHEREGLLPNWNAKLTHSPCSLGTSIPSSSRSPQGTSVEAHLNPLSNGGKLKQMLLT
jgi:hypothetical protein